MTAQPTDNAAHAFADVAVQWIAVVAVMPDSVDAHLDGWIAAQRDDGEPPHVEQVSELQVRLDGEQG